VYFFFSSSRRHTRSKRDWSSDVCSSDLEANMAMHNADLILAVGSRCDDCATNDVKKFCPNEKIVHIDIDPATISKNIVADVPIVGPVKQVLEDMIVMFDEHAGKPDEKALDAWWQEINGWRKVH